MVANREPCTHGWRRTFVSITQRSLSRVTLGIVAAICLVGVWPAALAATDLDPEVQSAPVATETQATDEVLEEGSAWYPPAGAQGSGQGATGPIVVQEPGTVTDPEVATEEDRKPPSAELVIAPIPFSNPTFGAGLILAPAYIFPLDPQDMLSPPSTVALGAMYSSNDSKAFAAGGNVHYDEDRHRVSGGIGYFDINYDFFGIGSDAGDQGLSVPR